MTDEIIISKIYLIRNEKVMLDRDLAELYGVQTRDLNKAVSRNRSRFPPDFMFRLVDNEFKNLMFQIGTSSWGGTRKKPQAFTEQRVAMLSSVLKSKRAVAVNIHIIRVFTRMRRMLLTHKDILLQIQHLEKQIMKQDGQLKKHEKEMQMIFTALKNFLIRKLNLYAKSDLNVAKRIKSTLVILGQLPMVRLNNIPYQPMPHHILI